jgi:hypothetical protein
MSLKYFLLWIYQTSRLIIFSTVINQKTADYIGEINLPLLDENAKFIHFIIRIVLFPTQKKFFHLNPLGLK